MTLLPIVDRELRVAARRGITYWSRVVAAVLAILIAAGIVTVMQVSNNSLGTAPGSVLFGFLKWLSFPCVCLAGVFLTSDCLSEEKRDGTLGLLFLTDLRGYDVVFGKLLAGSLRAAYGLLAIFPVLALTLLMGGVSGGEFWRMMLILCNTLFFSLSAGVFISSISREAMKAMNGTLLVVLLSVVAFPLIDWTVARWNPARFNSILSLASPGYSFVTAGPSPPTTFWLNLGIPHGMAWLFLALASLSAPRAWQEKRVRRIDIQANSLAQRWRFGTARWRATFRRRLLAQSPVLWLARRDQWLARVIWVAWLLAGALLALLYGASRHQPAIAFTGQAVYYLLALAFLLWLSSQASRFFVEARRNGALELMLITPLSVREIIGAQARALCRMFLVPVLLLLLLKVTLGVMQIAEMRKTFAGAATAGPPAGFENYQMVALATSVVNFPGDMIAVGCFGMWMGLTTKKTTMAVLKTLVFVVVLPWLALSFIQGMLMALGMFTVMGGTGAGMFRFIWIPTIIIGALNLGKDIVFATWSWRKLHSGIRAEASLARGDVFVPSPLSLAPRANVPPVIAPICLIGSLLFFGLNHVQGGPAMPHPNVLFLFSDDQRFDTIRALGNAEISTPNLDRLTRRGFAFTHAFIMGAGQPAVCVPSRAMLMTGRTLFRATTRFDNSVISPAVPLWPEVMRQAGYDAYVIGKWHNDPASLTRAFTGGGPIFLGGMADHRKLPVYDFDPSGAYAKTNEHLAAGFSSEAFADAAVEFLRSRKTGKPFFLYVAFTAPHDPRTPPKEFADKYPVERIRLPKSFQREHSFDNGELRVRDEKLLPWPRTPEAVRREIANYYGMISHLDAQIGRILAALEASGRAANTLVVFAGDNGLAVGRHGLLGKQNLYEHSVRVPLLLAGPGIAPGKRSDALCYLLDLFPTVCELTGVSAPATVEGRSLAPIIHGRQTHVRSEIFGAYRDVQRMLREQRWKLIGYPKIQRWQLFDVNRDPDELLDLSGEPKQARRLAAMKERMAALQKELGDSLADPK